MQCQNCKELLPDDSTFCQYCGAMLDADAQTACPDAGQRETMTTPEIGLRRRASRKRERGRKAPRFLFPVLTIVFASPRSRLWSGAYRQPLRWRHSLRRKVQKWISFRKQRACIIR